MNIDDIYNICDAAGLRSGSFYQGSSRWGPHISISCPLAIKNHKDSEDYNLSCSVSVSDEPSFAHCFSYNCKFKGSFIKMLRQASELRPDNLVFSSLVKKLSETERFTLEASIARSSERLNNSIKLAAEQIKTSNIPVLDKTIIDESRITRFVGSIPRYALKRGISVKTAKKWGLGYDKVNKRLVFPVRRTDGKLIGITGRDITGKADSKYHNYAGLDKSKHLFGEQFLTQQSPIIIVEGQIDAIITEQHLGIPTVAILGEGFSKNHVKTMASFDPPFVCIFTDNDEAGRFAAEKIEYGINGRFPAKLMLIPNGKKDPGELKKREAVFAFENAIPILGRIDWTQIMNSNLTTGCIDITSNNIDLSVDKKDSAKDSVVDL